MRRRHKKQVQGLDASFVVDPVRWASGEEHVRAVESVATYVNRFSGGWFERMVAASDPDRITAADLVAVTSLGTTIPAEVTTWVLGEGRRPVRRLLSKVSPEPIWEQDASVLVDPRSALNRTWQLLRSERGGWPATLDEREAAVVTGRLLAAKRPHLVPIFDDDVSAALGHGYGGYVPCWHTALLDEATRAVAADVRARAARLAPAAADLPLLRVLGIAVWMRERGWRMVPPVVRPWWADEPPGRILAVAS